MRGWSFNDEAVVAEFESEFRESVPGFESMRETVTQVAAHLLERSHRDVVVDLGCARGGSLRPLVDRFGTQADYRGYDASEGMLAAAAGELGERADRVKLLLADLRDGLPFGPPAAVVLSVLTLQFIPVELRPRLLREVWEALTDNGALVLVEKVQLPSYRMTELFRHLHEQTKAEHFRPQQIAAKRDALQNVLVPLTAQANEDLLRAAGFTHVERIWQVLNFVGWVAVR